MWSPCQTWFAKQWAMKQELSRKTGNRFLMEQVFDGTGALTYRHEPHAGVVNRSAIPYECLAEVRTIREDIMNGKVESMLASVGRCGPNDNYLGHLSSSRVQGPTGEPWKWL